MRSLFFLLLLLAANSSSAQKVLSVEEAAARVGDSVQFCGDVISFRYAVQETGKPTFFYFGNRFPNQVLTIVIWEKHRKNFSKRVELAYGNATICVRGRVQLVDGKPVVEVSSEDQIGVREEEDE